MVVPAPPPDQDAIIDHYEELDRFYRELWGVHVHHGLWLSGRETSEAAVEQLIRYVAEQANLQPGHTVCDIGSGYGATARLLASRLHAQVTALTLVPAQHAYAVRHNPDAENPRYLLQDWLENGLPDRAFDAAIAIESTEHMADKVRAFAEAYRVLRPGGRLVVCAWIADERPVQWQRRYLLEPICKEGRLPGLGSASDYVALMGAAGFVMDRVVDLSRGVRATWAVCLRRVIQHIGTDASYRRFLWSRTSRNRIFVLTLARIWLAYRSGAMRYLVFVAHRP